MTLCAPSLNNYCWGLSDTYGDGDVVLVTTLTNRFNVTSFTYLSSHTLILIKINLCDNIKWYICISMCVYFLKRTKEERMIWKYMNANPGQILLEHITTISLLCFPAIVSNLSLSISLSSLLFSSVLFSTLGTYYTVI